MAGAGETGEAWLEQQLLGMRDILPFLDADMVGGLVSYCPHASDNDVSEYLKNLIGESDRAKAIVLGYITRRNNRGTNQSATPGNGSGSGSGLQAYVKPKIQENHSYGNKNVTGGKQKEKMVVPSVDSKDAERSQVREMPKSQKGKKKGKGVGLSDIEQGKVLFQRKGPCDCQAGRHLLVNNCLSCGKIVCVQEGEGPCLFCGALVLKEGSEYAGMEAMDLDNGVSGRTGGLEEGEDKAVAAAIAFKNRMVEYDRTSAQRTSVIDDQSDYFESESSKWLSLEEKDELRRRQAADEAAAEEKKKKVVVTFDLIGRKVLMDASALEETQTSNDNLPPGSSLPLFNSPSSFKVKPNPSLHLPPPTFINSILKPSNPNFPKTGFSSLSSSNNNEGKGRVGDVKENKGKIDKRGTVGVKIERIQHDDPLMEAIVGGSLEEGRERERGRESQQSWEESKGSISEGRDRWEDREGEGGECRVFGTEERGKERGSGLKTSEGRNGGGGGGGGGGSGLGKVEAREVINGSGKSMGARGGGNGRERERESRPKSSQEIPLFDICLDDKGGMQKGVVQLAPSSFQVKRMESQKRSGEGEAVEVLMEGMVLLRQWLTQEEQISIVKECRQLGNSPGGFYLPKFGDGSSLRLHMMCLGQHWEPNTRSYGPRRTFFDNSEAPPIPQFFSNLVERALQSGKTSFPKNGSSLPSMVPDVCLANFYEQTGALGMHQDKDESPSSLQRGLPVVSFSLGDSADFVYGKERNPDLAKTLVLSSGDVLIFGGPARMVFHGVSKVHSKTAPHWLIKATGLRPGRLNLTFRQL